jgi:hypothetical protein
MDFEGILGFINNLEKNLSIYNTKNQKHLSPRGTKTDGDPEKRTIVMSDRGVPHPHEFTSEVESIRPKKGFNNNGLDTDNSNQNGFNTHLRIHRAIESNRGIFNGHSEEENTRNRNKYMERAIPPKQGKYKEPMSEDYLRYMMANALEAGHTGVSVHDPDYDPNLKKITGAAEGTNKSKAFLANPQDENIKRFLKKDGRKERYFIYDNSKNRIHSQHAFSVDQAIDFLHFPDHHDVSHLHLVPVKKAQLLTREDTLNPQLDYKDSGAIIDTNKRGSTGQVTGEKRKSISFDTLRDAQKKINQARTLVGKMGEKEKIYDFSKHPSEHNDDFIKMDYGEVAERSNKLKSQDGLIGQARGTTPNEIKPLNPIEQKKIETTPRQVIPLNNDQFKL